MIQGEVVDNRTQEAIEGAEIRLAEDYRVGVSATDASGEYILKNIPEGEYTIIVTAPGYYNYELTGTVVGDETLVVDSALRPFVGYEETLVYDDGTADNARAFDNPGAGWAMRMTPADMAQLRGVYVYLWD